MRTFNPVPSFNWYSLLTHKFSYSKCMFRYFMRRSIIVIFFLDVFDRDSFDSAGTKDYSFILAITLQDHLTQTNWKRLAVYQWFAFNGSLRRVSLNFPIILWAYLNLIPVLLWMYSPNSLLVRHGNSVRRVLNLGGLEERPFSSKSPPTYSKNKKHIVLRIEDNVILSLCYSYESVNNSRNIYKQCYTDRESRMTKQFLSDANSYFTKPRSWQLKKSFCHLWK